MKFKASAAALAIAAVFAASAPAQSQQPTISSAWDEMKLSQDECFARARSTFERKRFTRVEIVGNTVFADRGTSQFGIRCVSNKQMFYVFGGAPANDDKQLENFIVELRNEFSGR